MITDKHFHFTDETDLTVLSCSSSDDEDGLDQDASCHICTECCLNVKISEQLNPSYGLFIWPCSPVLAQFVWHNRQAVKGKTVLELGAGTGLPSIVAAKCGARVIVTDGENLPKVFECCQHNMDINNVPGEQYKMMELCWGTFSPQLLSVEPIDVILGSDIFYEPKVFEDAVVTVAYILTKSKSAEFWFTYEERNTDWTIEHILKKWHLSCQQIALESFGVSSGCFKSWNMKTLENIQMFVCKVETNALS